MKFYIEHAVTLYHTEVFEANSLEEARKMRDNTTWEYDEHLGNEFIGRVVTKDDMSLCDYTDMGEVDWPYDGEVISREEFIKKYTSLEV